MVLLFSDIEDSIQVFILLENIKDSIQVLRVFILQVYKESRSLIYVKDLGPVTYVYYHMQIGSHPNIYVLDTPGVLPPQIHDVEVCTKLALTGTIIIYTFCALGTMGRVAILKEYICASQGELHPVICGMAGTIVDYISGEKELAQCFLAILNRSNEYKKWANLSNSENGRTWIDHNIECSNSSKDIKEKRQYSADHSQVCMLLLLLFRSHTSRMLK